MKTCRKCKTEKDFKLFYKHGNKRFQKYKNTAAGYQEVCKDCLKDKVADYRKRKTEENSNWQIEVSLKHSYGITLKEWNEIFDKQNGCCAVCATHQADLDKKLRVDHCHKTGPVRGLLCDRCNVGIGMLKDNTLIMQNAIKYLNDFYSVPAETGNAKVILLKKEG